MTWTMSLDGGRARRNRTDDLFSAIHVGQHSRYFHVASHPVVIITVSLDLSTSRSNWPQSRPPRKAAVGKAEEADGDNLQARRCFQPRTADVSRLLRLMVRSIPTASSSSAKSSLNQADLAGCDRLLIPLDAYARRLWNVNLPVANFEMPLQDRIAPIQPFQEVCALRHAHDMRADLWIEMRRYGNACNTGDRRRPQKSRHAADAHEIGHNEVAGLLLQREVNVARAVEIFAYLDRRLQFGGEPGAAVEIVVEDRFLDPAQAMIVNHVAAPQGVGEIEGLVEIDHQVDILADRIPHRLYGREVVACICADQPKLHGSESSATLVEQVDRLGCRGFRGLQPQSVAVVGFHGPDRAAEQNAQRHVRRFSQRVPGRHVEASHGDHRQALVSDEMKGLAGRFVEIDR